MKRNDQVRIEQLLKQALPPVESGCESARDLWPEVLQRLNAPPASLPWFDWALLAGLIAFAIFFPAAIPVFLYYL